METFPDILVSVRAQRAFLGRAVHYLVAEAGIRQFLDIGTGLPSGNNTHEHVAVPLTARSHDEVSAFFAGLALVEPGVVQLHRWRAGTGDPGTGRELANYGGAGRKP